MLQCFEFTFLWRNWHSTQDRQWIRKYLNLLLSSLKPRKSWQQLYNTWAWIAKKKPGQNFTISVGLTRRSYLLLKKGGRNIKYNEAINFVFADIICFLEVMLNDGLFGYLIMTRRFLTLGNFKVHLVIILVKN